MSGPRSRRLLVRVWPDAYVVARLRALPAVLPRLPASGSPVAIVAGHEEVSVLAPATFVEALATEVEHLLPGWRALTLDAVFPPGVIGVLAAAGRVLAEAGVPLMVFSSHDTDHFLVPERLLGRALASLNQARLERFLA